VHQGFWPDTQDRGNSDDLRARQLALAMFDLAELVQVDEGALSYFRETQVSLFPSVSYSGAD
jgi:hypothetical protein